MARSNEKPKHNRRAHFARFVLTTLLVHMAIFPPGGGSDPPGGGTPSINRTYLVTEHLGKYNTDKELVSSIATAVVEMADTHSVPYDLIVGIILKENTRLDLEVRGTSGEYGLMQIMPFHVGRFSECGEDIRNIRTNICYGVNIFLEHSSWCGSNDLRCALLGYNGCVTGPYCFGYPDDVNQHRKNLQTTEDNLLYEIYAYSGSDGRNIHSRFGDE